MPSRKLPGLIISIGLLAFACLQSAGQAHKKTPPPLPPSFAKDVKPLISKYCLQCHGGAEPAAGLNLTKLLRSTDYAGDLETWGKVSSRLGSSQMPPAGNPQPSDTAKQRAMVWVENKANEQCRLSNPGRVTIRRLNRAEYNNTIRDLTGLDIHPADDFPSDDVGYGFDDIGDVLSISPLLMEKYLTAAEHILNTAIPGPGKKVQHIEATSMSKATGVVNGFENGLFFSSNAESFKTVTIESPGQYKFRVFAGGDLAGPEVPHMAVDMDGNRLTEFNVGVTRHKATTYEVPVTLSAGKHRIGLAFTNDYYNLKDPPGKQDRNLWVGYFELEAVSVQPPAPTEAELRIIPHPPVEGLESRDAKLFISKFASKAYRRPLTDDELDRLMKVYAIGRQNGDFKAGIKLAAEATLSSPNFIFRVELDPRNTVGNVRPLNDFELASRLSYFLWSSMPDDELFSLAKQGRLHDSTVLNAQVERMVRDPKSEALADNFAGQWLQLRKLAIVDPDPKRFPGINGVMKRDMATETKMFFDEVLRENHPITDFIDGKYTYVNARLANLYEIPGITDNKLFQRVALTGERGGVLTQASVLLVTSNPTRTSPTKRGKWVLEQILGTPPPPPPPGVGVINDEKTRIDGATLRQLMEEHRKNPMCAACHAKMDPIGFGLENFDAVGRWRTMDGASPLDTSGTLPNGVTFKGPAALKQILLKDKGTFAHALAEKLLTYALGRGPEPSDKCALDGIVKQAAAQKYDFASLIEDVVQSDPFRKRSTQTTK